MLSESKRVELLEILVRLFGSVDDGDAVILFQDGENWYAFKLPKQT